MIRGLLFWVIDWTWSAAFDNTAQRVVLFILEGGVLIASLSLLIESFTSFGRISVETSSKKFVLFGLNLFYEDGKKTPVTVRTCELFAVRSMVLAMFSLVMITVVLLFWEMVKFLLNPHVPTVNFAELQYFGISSFCIFVLVAILYRYLVLLEKKVEQKTKAIRFLILGTYGLTSGSLVFGFILAPIVMEEFGGSFYLGFIYATGIMLSLLLVLGAIVGLGYGLYRLAGKAIMFLSQRFPKLNDVWNLLCPVQTITFVE